MGARHHPFQQPDGDRQQADAEDGLDGVHPGARPGQQMPAAGADDEQRHAHAEPKGEQGGCAEHGVPGWR